MTFLEQDLELDMHLEIWSVNTQFMNVHTSNNLNIWAMLTYHNQLAKNLLYTIISISPLIFFIMKFLFRKNLQFYQNKCQISIMNSYLLDKRLLFISLIIQIKKLKLKKISNQSKICIWWKKTKNKKILMNQQKSSSNGNNQKQVFLGVWGTI